MNLHSAFLSAIFLPSKSSSSLLLRIHRPPSATLTPLPFSRRTILQTLTLFAASRALPASARGLPTGSLGLKIPPSSLPGEWPYTSSDFTRVDTEPDIIFYASPRLTRHIDSAAVAALTKHLTSTIASSRATRVLDLCASIESYLPAANVSGLKRLAGLGLNADEMAANPSLTEPGVVFDLNVPGAVLPYGDAEFDLVFCAVSFDYLIRPREVLAEVARVLRPGGRVVIAFSDRLFVSKAVSAWTGSGDADHADYIATALRFAVGFDVDSIEGRDLSPRQAKDGDPLYTVEARVIG
eukprot:Plantae.Rhodophyta-Palmaria_palmata.ctg6231.p1 GENE.Plantae.Rhodophyta-Palmaria_palmata.ctg6231~~Plantae.Rhodophyta-Palmaria_palmata.ctg6231.p1  ORF type:complete len:296 (-),score=30.32 Plantae.Rhodophyta-Palmaria_palmata.ctg6231:244-1131(-)